MKSENLKNALMIIVSFVIGGVFTFTIIDGQNLLGVSKQTGTTSYGATCSAKNCTKVVVDESGISSSVDKVYDAVVLVQTYKDDEAVSTGTGFVYKQDEKYSYIMTNQHVISGGDSVKIVTSKDKEIDAKILGGDSYIDIAVLRVDKDDDLKTASLGNSETTKLGDFVFTIGSPLGYEYRGSVTTGHLSGKDRMVSVSTTDGSSDDWIMRVLQTDAAINPGNSGGPLLNINGEVIGINSMKLVETEVEGMGFAIPIEYAVSHVDTLEKGDKIEWPMLGISMLNTTDVMALYREGITISKNMTEGAVVVETEKGSGAEEAGLEKGDIITELEGNKIKNSAYLRYELYMHKPGDTIEITYIRDGKEKKTKVKLSKMKED